jgi:AraC-like DNA-binding protein
MVANMFQQEYSEDYFISIKEWAHQMPSMHYHNSYELYYLDSGEREYFVEDDFFSVTAGSFVLIPPSVFHKTGGSYARRILIGFTHDFLTKTYTPEAAKDILECFNKTLVSPPEKVLNRCKSLLNILNECETERDFAIYLGNLLCELSKCREETKYNDQMSMLLEYINTHFAEINSIEQIAKIFYISKHHLCRIFKKTMGLTLIDYLNNIEIKNACDYLTSTNKSIQEIAELCGFNSPTYFSNVFKRHTMLSPHEYRKRKKQL